MELGLLGPKGRLIAIEPFPQNLELLNRNLALNGWSGEVTIIEGAISDTSSTKQFHISSHSNLGTFHPEGSGSGLITGHTINVQTYTISELAHAHGPPDLIRMDVEGHEVEVIDGMIEAIRAGRMRPKIIFETHLSRYSTNHSMERTLKRLFDCDYCVPYAATSWQRGTEILRNMGYPIGNAIKTDGVERVIVENITAPDAIQLICNTGGLRTVVLAPKPK
jgi:FkbM family methyltransferase